MVTEGQQKHRAGALKQANKAHKTGRHRSKGSICNSAKGKVDIKTFTKGTRKELNKEARRHQAQQIRQKKRDEAFAQKRNLGGGQAPPIIVTIVPLHKQVHVDSIVSLLTDADETASVVHSQQGTLHIAIRRFKQRLTFLVPQYGDVFAILDAAKVSTILLFAVSVAEAPTSMRDLLDADGEEMINACRAQGLPSSIMVMTDLESVALKKRQQLKQSAQSYLNKWLPEEKIVPLDKPADALNLLRKISTQKQTNVSYMSKRAYLLAESLEYTSADNTLKISGFLRGTPLSVNGLVHIPGFGDFQMSQIDKSPDPFALDDNHDRTEETLEIADPTRQESLESENVPDPMDAEQTWPTEEEMAEATAEKSKKRVKLVPKGTSDYQAAWIIDEADEESDNSDSDDEKMSMADSDTHSEAADDDEQDMCSTSEISPDANQYDEQMDLAEEREAIEKLKEAKMDAQFPDEVDTPPVGTFAKDRFQKYRGLQSFRTSPWDPKENLPLDYARIFQFQCFNRTRKRILKEQQDVEGVPPGQFVVLHIKNVSSDLIDAYMTRGSGKPLVVIGLLPNEQKMSLLNVVLKHVNPHEADPIKSKEKLMFQCGFRRFSACPIFSQHTNSSKHKYARFFQPGDTVVASMYAPIIFPPCTVLCYKEGGQGLVDLVATGSVLSADPNRLVIKRVVLSGHPFKVHKKSAVIRFMFNHREDILWFKPVQLHTKYGRRGHIREPLGTHGHMKCVFDGQLKSQDTVLMNLYKRIFPKWTYEPVLFTSR